MILQKLYRELINNNNSHKEQSQERKEGGFLGFNCGEDKDQTKNNKNIP